MATIKQIWLKIRTPFRSSKIRPMLSYADLKCFFFKILYRINSLWQTFWDFCDRNKLYCVQNIVDKSYNFSLNRQDEIIISRIRVGHSTFTLMYPLQGEQQPECIFHDCPLYIYTTHFSRVFRHIARAELTFR